MESIPNDFVTCSKCKNDIIRQNIIIHEARCSRIQQEQQMPVHDQMSQQKENKQNNKKDLQTQINQQQSQVQQNIRQDQQQVQEEQKIDELDSFNCPVCQENISFIQLENHMNECNPTCDRCQQSFPKYLMEDHRQICNNNQQNQQRERQQNINPRELRNVIFHRNQQQNRRQNEQGLLQFQFPFLGLLNMRVSQQDNQEDEEYHDPRHNLLMMILNHLQNGEGNFDFSNNGGIQEDKLKEFPVSEYKKQKKEDQKEEDKCTICMSEYEDGDKVKYLDCFHTYHVECIDIWLKKNSTCPVCKKDMRQFV